MCSFRPIDSARQSKKKPIETPPKPKPIKLNTDDLPTITEILQELNLSDYLDHFVR